MAYLIIIAMANAVIAAADAIRSDPITAGTVKTSVAITFLASTALFAIDAVTALFIRRCLPESLFSPKRTFFHVKKAEKQLFRFLRISKWADNVPELGGLTGFRKNKLADRHSKQYIERYLLESNYGRVIHAANGVCGYFILFLPYVGKPSIAVPAATVNLWLSLLPIAVLKNNSYSLKRIYDKIK